jgi:hypothetical protein
MRREMDVARRDVHQGQHFEQSCTIAEISYALDGSKEGKCGEEREEGGDLLSLGFRG